MRHAILLAALALVPACRAGTKVVWEETPTHRVKVKYLDGEEVGRWRFRKKEPPRAPPEDRLGGAEVASPPDPRLPEVTPILDREILEVRLAELRARQRGEQLEGRQAWRRTGTEILALAAESMQAALRRDGATPGTAAFVRLAAETFDPGDASVALPEFLRPQAEAVVRALRQDLGLVPPGAKREARTGKFEDLLRISGIRRATRQPDLALAAAEEAEALLEGVDYPAVELARARARKARALALLAREERVHASGFQAKEYVGVPSQASCREAVQLLEESEELFAAGLRSVQRMAETSAVPRQALPRMEVVREHVGDLRGLIQSAGQCQVGLSRPLGASRLVEKTP